RAFPAWLQVMRAELRDVQRQIAVCGLARMRARRLQAILRAIHDERGRLELEFLGKLPPEQAYAYLTKFFGIGPKTAACTLLFAFNQPLFPVDKGILRLSKRLRLVSARSREQQLSLLMQRHGPRGKLYSLHVLMFAHAKRVCRPRNPRCDACRLIETCSYGR